ncbi:MAG: hypothetical protein M3044_19675, partial [Thermoproteota archaeon]|nr:hypothetical protein [Thermoproteota archaeon]
IILFYIPLFIKGKVLLNITTSRGLPLNAIDEIHCCGMALRMSPTSKRDKERLRTVFIESGCEHNPVARVPLEIMNSINEGLYTKSLIVRICMHPKSFIIGVLSCRRKTNSV